MIWDRKKKTEIKVFEKKKGWSMVGTITEEMTVRNVFKVEKLGRTRYDNVTLTIAMSDKCEIGVDEYLKLGSDVTLTREEAIAAARAILAHFGEE